MKNVKRINHNFQTLLMVSAVALMIFVMGCNPNAENKNDETETDSVAMEDESSDMMVDDAYMSSTGMNNDEMMDEYTEKYPDMRYSYMETPEGRLATQKGKYDLKIEGVDNQDDLGRFTKYVEDNYAMRKKARDEFNKPVEEAATPASGYDGFTQSIQENTEYPSEALSNDVGGTVFVEFTVDKEGKIKDVEAMEGMYYTRERAYMDELDQAAVAAVQNANSNWKPAMQGDKAVPMKLEVPITFDPEG